ncbi:hypothetical protein NPIL_208831 [Nephila pilipes]|uniref:Uncharacterized protein n=1 Tax=Nephila pilipes TaxID=299642 RepID=A0A8X6JVQ7_NEPPI|nr:hypothetical protein NPIL_208831 [Nephila pilipes]
MNYLTNQAYDKLCQKIANSHMTHAAEKINAGVIQLLPECSWIPGNSSGIPGPEVDFGWKYPRKWNPAKDVFRRKDEKDRFVETVWSRLG